MNDSISIKQAVELLEQDGLLVGYDCPPQLLEHRLFPSVLQLGRCDAGQPFYLARVQPLRRSTCGMPSQRAQGSTLRSRFMKGWTAHTFWSATFARR